MSDILYLLVQFVSEGSEKAAGEIAILDGVGRVARVRGAYDLILRVDDEEPEGDAGSGAVSEAVLAVPGVLHVVPVRVPDLPREE